MFVSGQADLAIEATRDDFWRRERKIRNIRNQREWRNALFLEIAAGV